MGAEAFEAEYAAGRALTPDEVLTLAGGGQARARSGVPANRC
jgi:hypothetical protein